MVLYICLKYFKGVIELCSHLFKNIFKKKYIIPIREVKYAYFEGLHLNNLPSENSHDIINGRISSIPQSLAEGSYFGGRNPEDGRIDLTQSHKTIFNLVRAVLPYPRFPGAFFGDNHIIDVSLTPVNSIKGWIKIYGCDGIPVFCKCLNS